MRNLLYLFIVTALMFSSCSKSLDGKKTNDGDVDTSAASTLSNIDIPADFDWKTTKDLEVNISLPEGEGIMRTKITSVDGTKTYFKGYPSDTTQRLLQTKITVPAYLEVLKVSNGVSESFIDITGYQLSADFNIINKQSNTNKASCGECDGQITYLELEYIGEEVNPEIVVTQKKKGNHNYIIFEGTVNELFEFWGANNKNKMGAKIKLYVNGEFNVEIHTSCSITILAGMVFGDFKIAEGESSNGGALCYVEEDEPIIYSGTVIYEDLYPAKGDYDFNDLVVEYSYEVNKADNNYVDNIEATFTVKAFGASYHNAFGFQFPGVSPTDVASVTGGVFKENTIFNMMNNGVEANQSKATFIVYDDAFAIMSHPGSGIGVNTTPGAPYVDPATINLSIEFNNNAVNIDDLDIGNFNPFIVMKQERGYEVHLANYEPTDLFDSNLYGVYDDASNAASGVYFVTENQLPWAINIPDGFDYMNEKSVISSGYLKFIQWAESGGTQFQDWYMDNSGYRNAANIYVIP